MCALFCLESKGVSSDKVFHTQTMQGATSTHALAAHQPLTYWQ